MQELINKNDMIILHRARYYEATATYTIEVVQAHELTDTSVVSLLSNGKRRFRRRVKKNEAFFLAREDALEFLERRLSEELERIGVEKALLERKEALVEKTYAKLTFRGDDGKDI